LPFAKITEDFPMPGNWMDDRERQIRERDARGLSDYRGRGGEDRSWDREDRSDTHGARGGQDRVFGERESGAGYGRASRAYGASSSRGGWQDPHYGGVSPAMRQGAYGQGARFSSQDYSSGGRFYGDDDREPIYREEYGQGGVEYGDTPRGYDAQRSPTRERYHNEGYGQPGFGGYPGEDREDMDRPAAGGTGGYDYERGYGDGGRRDTRRTERFEDAGRNAGDFLHRAGEKVASWFGGGGEAPAYEPGAYGRAGSRGARGLGPQGYKRSDERISDDAHERLTDDAWLDASNISISVSGCEVTLSGTVETREAKHRAERLVENISGVVHVQNNLRLAKANFLTRPTSGYGDSVLDAEMRRDDPTANGTGGSGGGQSTAGKKN
jgi:osmotically-inducible protein OsmY